MQLGTAFINGIPRAQTVGILVGGVPVSTTVGLYQYKFVDDEEEEDGVDMFDLDDMEEIITDTVDGSNHMSNHMNSGSCDYSDTYSDNHSDGMGYISSASDNFSDMSNDPPGYTYSRGGGINDGTSFCNDFSNYFSGYSGVTAAVMDALTDTPSRNPSRGGSYDNNILMFDSDTFPVVARANSDNSVDDNKDNISNDMMVARRTASRQPSRCSSNDGSKQLSEVSVGFSHSLFNSYQVFPPPRSPRSNVVVDTNKKRATDQPDARQNNRSKRSRVSTSPSAIHVGTQIIQENSTSMIDFLGANGYSQYGEMTDLLFGMENPDESAPESYLDSMYTSCIQSYMNIYMSERSVQELGNALGQATVVDTSQDVDMGRTLSSGSAHVAAVAGTAASEGGDSGRNSMDFDRVTQGIASGSMADVGADITSRNNSLEDKELNSSSTHRGGGGMEITEEEPCEEAMNPQQPRSYGEAVSLEESIMGLDDSVLDFDEFDAAPLNR
jgi:hypothetical protein